MLAEPHGQGEGEQSGVWEQGGDQSKQKMSVCSGVSRGGGPGSGGRGRGRGRGRIEHEKRGDDRSVGRGGRARGFGGGGSEQVPGRRENDHHHVHMSPMSSGKLCSPSPVTALFHMLCHDCGTL